MIKPTATLLALACLVPSAIAADAITISQTTSGENVIEINGALTVQGSAIWHTGDIKHTLATSEPPGWRFLNGQDLPRSGATGDLFALFGTTFGAGNGTTTFNLPDARGRTLASRDNLGGSAAGVINAPEASQLGGQSGLESAPLTQGEMPSHNHGLNIVQSGHEAAGYGAAYGSSGFGDRLMVSAAPNSYASNAAGGSQPVGRVQPTLFVNVLIKE
ncbi:MAG: tail fiber protein [Planctomycetota bacterium]|jgi:microcystin-dependent protein|nr:tail fiber protein [Planctomycetota bacterium]